MTTLRSNGETTARAYGIFPARGLVGAPAVSPLPRVQIAEPSDTATVERGVDGMARSPRNPEQRFWRPPGTKLLELPDNLPMTVAQRVYVAPELVARWQAEARHDDGKREPK